MFRTLCLLAVFTASSCMAGQLVPGPQADFTELVSIVRQLGLQASNDVELGSFRARREKALCMLLPRLAAQNWLGTVSKVGANGDGKGILEITLAEGVYVKTWNNFLSDAFDHTLIEPGTDVHNLLMTLQKGDAVIFSGHFLADDGGGCLREASLTLSGKVTEPEFLFRFSSLRTDP